MPNAAGAPEAVRVMVRNFSDEPVVAVGLEALVFDGGGVLRREVRCATVPVGDRALDSCQPGPVPVGATVVVDVPVRETAATSKWNVAVAVMEVHLPSTLWRADASDVRRRALDVISSMK